MLRARRLDPWEQQEYGPRVAAIERGVSYPLGADHFEIDHGGDYFAFFRRLGAVHSFVAEDGEDVVGVLAAVERELRDADTGGAGTVLYLCDLKRRPGASARVMAALVRCFDAAFGAGRAGYAVSMNAADGSNRMAAALRRYAPDAHAVTVLEIFSLDASTAAAIAPVVVRLRGEAPTWRSLAGVKDIVLRSTGRPMDLLHAQLGPCADPGGAPKDGAVHMLCAPRRDALAEELRAMGIAPSASATVFARGMGGADWRFVLTSDV